MPPSHGSSKGAVQSLQLQEATSSTHGGKTWVSVKCARLKYQGTDLRDPHEAHFSGSA